MFEAGLPRWHSNLDVHAFIASEPFRRRQQNGEENLLGFGQPESLLHTTRRKRLAHVDFVVLERTNYHRVVPLPNKVRDGEGLVTVLSVDTERPRLEAIGEDTI